MAIVHVLQSFFKGQQLVIIIAVFSFVRLCEYTVSNENHLLHKSDT